MELTKHSKAVVSSTAFLLLMLSIGLLSCGDSKVDGSYYGSSPDSSDCTTTYFLAGGLSDAGTTSVSSVYSSTDGLNWTKIGDLPISSIGGALYYINNKFTYVGGLTLPSAAFSDKVYTSSDGVTWVDKGSQLSVGLEGFFNFEFLNTFFLLGGLNSSFNVSDLIFTSTDGINWVENATTLPVEILGGGRYEINSKLWLVGGVTTASFPNTDNTLFSSDDGINWVSETPTNLLDGGLFPSLEFDDKFWKIGGASNVGGAFTAYDTVQTTTDGLTWTDEVDLPSEIAGGMAYVIGNKIYLAGGHDGTNPLNTILTNTGSGSWATESSTLPEAFWAGSFLEACR